MPELPSLTPEELRAYEEARRRIQECWKLGNAGGLLDLGCLGLTRLPAEISQLTALKVLDLQNNRLTALPPEIGELTTLNKLGLGGNNLRQLPLEMGNLVSLSELWLYHNELSELPEVIGKLQALRALYLYNNKLTRLPSSVFELRALTWLDLSHNRFAKLSSKFSKLRSLTGLDLTGNRLGKLPPEIRQLTGLSALFLHSNPALQLPIHVLGPVRDRCEGYGGKEHHARAADILEYYFGIPEERQLRASSRSETAQQHQFGSPVEEKIGSTTINDQSIHIYGNVTSSQIGQTLTNCANLIHQQVPGELKTLLEQLRDEVTELIPKLPEEKRDETAENLELMVKGVTKKHHKWYSVSAEGLLEAATFVKDFSGKIAPTIDKLGKLLGF